eukprot:Phypoly_transcript_02916.p1 GENE.Phypoly_transcript_02916~~Phypoly_transcript_02916.p1  ORF type:complete len:851 (+),score=199.49 Phypoly_transcript_02916:105-2555(+)
MGGKHTKSLIKKLEERDVTKIKLVFNDLAATSGGKGIDIDTFKQFSQLSDMIAERAYVLFATKKPTLIDLEEFTGGLALCHRGSEKEKLKVIYRILAVHTDKVSKDEVAVVLNSAVSSPTWNTHSREDLKPPTELVQKLIEMGFPRAQCDKAVEATKATNVDDAVAWIVNHKPDPLADANVLLASIFEGHNDGFTNWKKFKKWAQGSKRPREFVGFLNGFPMLYERAILWSTATPMRSTTPTVAGAPKSDNLIDFTIEDATKPVQPAPTPVATVKEKRRSHRSLSHLMNRKSVDSVAPVRDQPPAGLGAEPAFLGDLTLAPTTPTLVPIPLNGTQPHPEPNPALPNNSSAPSTPVLPRLPSQPANSSAPTTPANIPAPPSTASASPSIKNRTMSSHTLNPTMKKVSSTGSDGWSSDEDDEEEHHGKPVIQVVIKDKATVESAKPADLKKAVSNIVLPDMPKPLKPRGHSSMGSGQRRTRQTNKFALESSFFDPHATEAELAEKARNSLGDDNSSTASGTSTPSGTPPLNSTQGPTLTSVPSHLENALSVTPPATPPAARPEARPTTPQNVSSAPSPSSTSQPANPATAHASEHMRTAMGFLEKGNFTESLKEVDKSLSVMLETGDPQVVKGEANFCVAYKVALGILIAIRDLDAKFAAHPENAAELAKRLGFLSKILSDIPLKTNHRIVCVRMAISKNMHPLAANYAVAARLVEALLLKGAPDREALQEKLKKCKENETDSSLPTYTCPHCSQQCSSASLKCACGRPVRWCFKTYELITTKNFFQCSFCNALVSTNTSVKAGDKCDFCNHGSFAER